MKEYIATLSSKKVILTGTLALSALVLLGSSLVSAPLFADTGKEHDKVCHGKKHHDHHKMKSKRPFQDEQSLLAMMERHIDLSDEQKTSITSIFAQYQPELDALHKQMQSMRDSDRALLQGDTLDESELSSVANQKAKLMSEMFVLKTRMKHAVQLQLTEDQRAAMEKVMQHRHERLKRQPMQHNDSSINPARLNVNPVLSPFVSVHI